MVASWTRLHIWFLVLWCDSVCRSLRRGPVLCGRGLIPELVKGKEQGFGSVVKCGEFIFLLLLFHESNVQLK
jgi:hypothetical protein